MTSPNTASKLTFEGLPQPLKGTFATLAFLYNWPVIFYDYRIEQAKLRAVDDLEPMKSAARAAIQRLQAERDSYPLLGWRVRWTGVGCCVAAIAFASATPSLFSAGTGLDHSLILVTDVLLLAMAILHCAGRTVGGNTPTRDRQITRKVAEEQSARAIKQRLRQSRLERRNLREILRARSRIDGA